MEKKKVRYAIIGIGKMGSTHARKLLKGIDKNALLTAVCDISEERKAWAKNTLSGVRFFDDYKDLLVQKDVDAVIVATPHYLHPVIAKEALIAGKHVLIEKPAGVYTKAIRELNELAASLPEQVFGIMYNQRTNPLYKKAKEIIESGQMGQIKRINWIITNWYRPQAYYDQGGWRGTWSGEGGGVLINQCPHQIDLFQWLGGMPERVRGFTHAGVRRRINVENDVTFYTEYANGASGVFVTSTHDYPGTNRLEISGDGGRLVIEQHLLSEKLTFNKLGVSETEFNLNNTKFMPLIPSKTIRKRTGTLTNAVRLGIVGQHANIIRNFSRAILFKEPLVAPGADGIRGLMLSNAVHLSGWLGGKELTLPIDEELFIAELEKRIGEEAAQSGANA
ncbi:MAG: Gfo/Idh/MocA family oxidoreductase [Clostridiales bacterium]|jgi:predicted dehydrogenase|nr:Gfo/Idh/MocA family oxidoreductase [Clostridiales bacterium]